VWRTVWGATTIIVTIPEIIGAGVLVLLLFLLVRARRQEREPLAPFVLFRDRNFTLMACWPSWASPSWASTCRSPSTTSRC